MQLVSVSDGWLSRSFLAEGAAKNQVKRVAGHKLKAELDVTQLEDGSHGGAFVAERPLHTSYAEGR